MANVPSIGVSQPHVQSIGVSQSLDLTEYIVYPSPRPSLRDGLVGAWAMDEGAGTVVHDLSGRGHHLDLRTGTTRTVTDKGKGLAFDGVDNGGCKARGGEYWDLVDGKPGMTVCAWMKSNVASKSDNNYICVHGNSSGDRVFLFSWDNGENVVFEVYNSSNDLYTARMTDGITDTNWHFVVGTIGIDGVVRVFVDGVEGGSTGAFTGVLQSGPTSGYDVFVVGCSPSYTTDTTYYVWDGDIHQLLIWNRGLVAAERNQLQYDPDAWRPSKQLIAYVPVAVTGGVGRLIDGGLVNSGLVYGRLTG